jgi:hypothetical protein
MRARPRVPQPLRNRHPPQHAQPALHGPEPHESPQAHASWQHDPEHAEAAFVVLTGALVMPGHAGQHELQDVAHEQSRQAHESPQQHATAEVLAAPPEMAVRPASAMEARNAFM